MSEQLPNRAPIQQETGAPHSSRRLAKEFRWQAFFQHCAEPVFVLDRRGHLLFVNRAWEKLTGLAKEEAHILVCRRPQPVSANDSVEEILAHALTPPPEVRRGASGCVRRLLPRQDRGDAASTDWWDVEFLPLLQEGEQGGYVIVGRIRPAPAVELIRDHPLSEKLLNLRRRRLEHFGLDAWASSLPPLRRLVEQARLASQVTIPVLLVGEAGTGKQTLARTIHYLSARREGAFAVLDCRHLPPAAVSTMVLGQEGVAAVYLREPAYLPRDVQLLLCERIAKTGEMAVSPVPTPAGGAPLLPNRNRSTEGGIGPRIFAGCTIPLAQAVHSGQMLEELACALSTLVIEVPPLRERLADLPALVERLLPRACAGRSKADSHDGTNVMPIGVTSLSPDAWALLRSYSWPGNLRELYNVLRTACAHVHSEQLCAADLPTELRRTVQREQAPPRPADPSLPLQHLLEEAERRLIQLALQRARGRKATAARLLGIPRPKLWRRMIKLGLADTEEEREENVGVE
jgi:transcriptional regulator with PAS, ATPase and Fis domain